MRDLDFWAKLLVALAAVAGAIGAMFNFLRSRKIEAIENSRLASTSSKWPIGSRVYALRREANDWSLGTISGRTPDGGYLVAGMSGDVRMVTVNEIRDAKMLPEGPSFTPRTSGEVPTDKPSVTPTGPASVSDTSKPSNIGQTREGELISLFMQLGLKSRRSPGQKSVAFDFPDSYGHERGLFVLYDGTGVIEIAMGAFVSFSTLSDEGWRASILDRLRKIVPGYRVSAAGVRSYPRVTYKQLASDQVWNDFSALVEEIAFKAKAAKQGPPDLLS